MIYLEGEPINVTIFPDKTSKSLTEPSDHEINLLTTVFENGKLLKETTLAEVRERVKTGLV